MELALIHSPWNGKWNFKFEVLPIKETIIIRSIPDRTPADLIDKIVDNINLDLIEEIFQSHLENNMLMKWQSNFLWTLTAKKILNR
ncbi:MAG: hypothetical protein KDC13_02385 [Bacteroidetes bacterium]|nr:hypothetical protein [Bacteroidota bacterium]